jgi:hypothetical protein
MREIISSAAERLRLNLADLAPSSATAKKHNFALATWSCALTVTLPRSHSSP